MSHDKTPLRGESSKVTTDTQEWKGLVGNVYGIEIAHTSNVGDNRKHNPVPAKCWCWKEEEARHAKPPQSNLILDAVNQFIYEEFGGLSDEQYERIKKRLEKL